MKLNLYDIFESIDAFKKIAKERSEKDAYIEDSNHIINKLAYSKWMFDLCSTYNNGKLVDLSLDNMQKRFDTDTELQKSFFNIIFNFIKKDFEGKFGLSNFKYEFTEGYKDFRKISIYFNNSKKKKNRINISIYKILNLEKSSDPDPSLITVARSGNKINHSSGRIHEEAQFTWKEDNIIRNILYFVRMIFNIAYNPINRFDVFNEFIQKIIQLRFYFPVPEMQGRQTIIILKDIRFKLISLFIRNFFIQKPLLYNKLSNGKYIVSSIDSCIENIYNRNYPQVNDCINYFNSNIRNNSQKFMEMIIDVFKKTRKFDTDIMLEDNFSQAYTCVEKMMKEVMKEATGINDIEVVYEK